MKFNSPKTERITTALLLAAGTGSRLFPLTQNAPKCLTIVNGTSILERLLFNLNSQGFKRLVVVTGHLQEHIRTFLGNRVGNIEIEYIYSPLYKETNNIYSLWMARKAIHEPFLLLESDLVFDESLLDSMVYPDRIAVAKMQSWMNGTSVTIDQSKRVKAFLADSADSFGDVKYKTVNIYSISLNSWKEMVIRLDKRIAEGKVNEYYETIFAEMIAEGNLSFESVSFDDNPWYEIDTLEDLALAEKLFAPENYMVAETAIPSQAEIPDMQLINVAIQTQKGAEVLNVIQ